MSMISASRAGVFRALQRLPVLLHMPARRFAAAAMTGSTQHNRVAMDGNAAAAHVAYALSDQAFVYPITPATPMGEAVDKWSAEKKLNAFGNTVAVSQMQHEGGVAGAMHGSLKAGALTSTYTSSQGLLLMIPNLFKMAGELLPGVVHVASRVVFTQGGSMFADWGDVMACRSTGVAMLCSSSVQEAMDFAAVAHMTAIAGSVPVVHFFEGFRTSHEVNTIETIPYPTLKSLVDKDAIARFRKAAVNPEHPTCSGTAQGPDVYMQLMEASNPYFDKLPAIMEDAFDKIAETTGRRYSLFEYTGHSEAERVIVMMGSAASIGKSVVESLVANDDKVGIIHVRAFRPWDRQRFMTALPPTAKVVAVLDRTKESAAQAEPLLSEVAASIAMDGSRGGIGVIGGRYGLGSKEFLPSHCLALFNEMKGVAPRKRFTLGIEDDVTFLSIPPASSEQCSELGVRLSPRTVQCLFWGKGSDGTVGANRVAVATLVKHGGLYGQAYFTYSAHKTNNLTMSHLRFGPDPIEAPYGVVDANYVAVHDPSYWVRYGLRLVDTLQHGGTLVLNAPWTDVESLSQHLPPAVKQFLAQRECRLYVIDAENVASAVGLGHRINMIMQAVFFLVSGAMPKEASLELLKGAITAEYSAQGQKVIDANISAVNATTAALQQIAIPASWGSVTEDEHLHDRRVEWQEALIAGAKTPSSESYVQNIVKPMLALNGDALPVSAFQAGGSMPTNTSKYEKRGLATETPVWEAAKCTQCNICVAMCPHAAIRAFVLDDEAVAEAPLPLTSVNARGALKKTGKQYTLAVATLDCTGCGLCSTQCPQKCLPMTHRDPGIAEAQNFEWLTSLGEDHLHHAGPADVPTIKELAYRDPMLEFSGACSACGQTPYLKMATQLFGHQMMIANATGCSQIYSSCFPLNPYTTDKLGHGPAWTTSLFEDNAEYGFGIAKAVKARRQVLSGKIAEALACDSVPEGLRASLTQLVAVWNDVEASFAASMVVKAQIEALRADGSLGGISDSRSLELVDAIAEASDLLSKKSMWIIGGDGWAYDIGFSGLDHVLASGENVNIVVLDTEVYSNTGGQASKATSRGAVHGLAAGGKLTAKKDLGALAVSYGHVYVASVAIGASHNQTLKAFKEAESFDGPSLILAYSTCNEHGIAGGLSSGLDEMKAAVKAGYWDLYRYDPRKGDKAMQIDAKPDFSKLPDFLANERRFRVGAGGDTDAAAHAHDAIIADKMERFALLQRFARQSADTQHSKWPEE